MLNLSEATYLVHTYMPTGTIQAVVEYKNLFIFQIFSNDEFEGDMDPFYSLDKETREFKDYSVLFDEGAAEVNALFMSKINPTS